MVNIYRTSGETLQVKANSIAHKLHKAGWRLYSRKRVGCMIVVKWVDPVNGQIRSQADAWNIAKLFNRNEVKKDA